MKYEKWEVWLANVRFEDISGTKKRPVLILDKKHGIAVSLKMTTHQPRNASEYALRDWAKVGLRRVTTVRTGKVLHLQNTDFIQKIGRLSDYDILQIQTIIT